MEDAALSVALVLGFLSGFKHAFEPDHVMAVSTLVHEEPKLTRALRTGLAWGAGHTTTLVAAVLAVGLLRVRLSATMLGYFELPVAIMLLALGCWALYGAVARLIELRRHEHDGVNHYHVGEHPHPHGFPLKRTGWQGYAVGLIHGLAGSGALLLLVAAALPSVVASVGYALLFGVGSVLGMGLVTAVLVLPFLVARSRPVVYHALSGLSGGLSVLLGTSILYSM